MEIIARCTNCASELNIDHLKVDGQTLMLSIYPCKTCNSKALGLFKKMEQLVDDERMMKNERHRT